MTVTNALPERPEGVAGTFYQCPYCNTSTICAVRDSRPSMQITDMQVIRRRRVCTECHGKFTTFEVPAGFINKYTIEMKFLDHMIDMLQKQRDEVQRKFDLLGNDGYL